MPRIARAVAVGYPHHVIQRGNNRGAVFFDEDDFSHYRELLLKYSRLHGTAIAAYCLMTNHVHMLLVPRENESLNKTMQAVALCYTQHANRKYSRTGRLWESRYHSCIVDRDAYLWAVARYIETNPLRARMARRAENYAHSSARAHITGHRDELLDWDLIGDSERAAYEEFVRQAAPDGEIEAIRYHARTGWPVGERGFVMRMQRKIGRELLPRPKGRPSKKAK